MKEKKTKTIKTKAAPKARKVPRGRTLTTQDNFLGKSNTGSKKKRGVVVIDTHNENLAVVPMSSKKGANRTELKGYGKNKKTYFKHFVETQDNEGRPIRVNQKFRENHKNMDVPSKQVADIRDTVLNHCKPMKENRKKLDQFKSKKKTGINHPAQCRFDSVESRPVLNNKRCKPAAEQRPDRVKSRSLHSTKGTKTKTTITKSRPNVKAKPQCKPIKPAPKKQPKKSISKGVKK